MLRKSACMAVQAHTDHYCNNELWHLSFALVTVITAHCENHYGYWHLVTKTWQYHTHKVPKCDTSETVSAIILLGMPEKVWDLGKTGIISRQIRLTQWSLEWAVNWCLEITNIGQATCYHYTNLLAVRLKPPFCVGTSQRNNMIYIGHLSE